MNITYAYPKYLKLLNKPEASVFRHDHGNDYWVDNGCWGCSVELVDGNLKISDCEANGFIGEVVVPATKSEYVKSVGRYASADGMEGLDDVDTVRLREIVSWIVESDLALIIRAYKQGILTVAGVEYDDSNDLSY